MFKQIKGCEHEISKDGKLIKGNRRIKSLVNKDGYRTVQLFKNGERYLKLVHKLILETYLGEAEGRLSNFIDGDKRNIRLSNLEWLSYSDKVTLEYKRGNQKAPRGELQGNSKLKTEEVLAIRDSENISKVELASTYNISKATIYDILAGRTWVHLLP